MNARTGRRFAAALLLALPLTGCDGRRAAIGPPAEVDLGVADAELRAFLTDLRAAAARRPEDGERRGRLAMGYEANGFAAAALAAYAAAQALSPADARWPHHRAMLLAHRGELEAALAALEQSIERHPQHAPAQLWRGAWRLTLGHLEEAEAAFEQAAALGAGAPAVVGRARVALRRGRPEHAAALLRPLGQILRHSDVAGLLAAAARRLGRAEEARAALADVSLGPLAWTDAWAEEKRSFEASLAAQLAAARRTLAGGDADGALAQLAPLRERHPRHQGLLAVLAEAHRRAGQREPARAVLVDAIAAHPDHTPFRLNMAELLIEEGDRAAAMPHLRRALAVNPRIPWAHAQRGLGLVAADDLAGALTAFASAARHDPNSPEPRYYAGRVEAHRGRWPEAIAHFRAAVRAEPTFALGHIDLARALAETGRADAAEAALAAAQAIGTHPAETAAARAQVAARRPP